ncbi:ADP-ribose pyrophosphatase [Zhongshania aliphaticivorans]|uniref:ADP-ribose pyrophosphatase n=1 Tax=Zhongshania aliphaticivorans TaxID=1470434 RepID=A0A5S9QHS2_9GAMM|nr:NUDIX domain-containing protein [Zhongshania aliphaticivorans]CAA0109493.1 ADP-ribose pyrophosphatase [Zhongshania aliphaticivorans]CAA0117694.1 ADP-ribose pyrophosphatase [Zhongshania aliphaticivorans]
MANFERKDVEIDEDRAAWRGFFQVRELRLRHRLFGGGWGNWLSRELFVRGPAVGLLPYDPVNDTILKVEQFRVGALSRAKSPWLLELVAGIIDTDESPADVARREAKEEAGLTIGKMESIAEYYSSPGGSDEYFYLFCGCADLNEAGGYFGLANEGEDIHAQVISFDDAMTMLDAGQINNAHSLIAMQWLLQHREELRRRWLA